MMVMDTPQLCWALRHGASERDMIPGQMVGICRRR